MYRMLIVDDEEYIANSLYYFFKSQEQLELDIYKCYDVDNAVKLLGRAKFDIVVTDIHMPDKNGMELLPEIKRLWEDCRVIILTGYSQFEYAYQALQYKNVTYLLKSEGYDKLLALVEQRIADIERESKREDVFIQLKGRLESLLPALQQELAERLLYRSVRKVTQQELDKVGCSMQQTRPVVLLLVRMDCPDDNLSSYDHEWINQMLIMEIDLHTVKKGILRIQATHEREIIYIFQYHEQDGDDNGLNMLLYLREMLPAMQEAGVQSGAMLSFSLSADFLKWEDIPREYVRLKRMLNTSVGLNKGVIVTGAGEAEQMDREGESMFIGIGDIQRLSSYLQAGKKDSFLAEFGTLTAALRRNGNMADEAARQCYIAAALVIVDYINWYCSGCNFKYDPKVLLHPEMLESWSQGIEMLESVYFEALDFMEQSRVKNTNWIVEKVKEYIDTYYMNDLSLVLIADYVHFNPSYLSWLYKEVASKNIFSYIKEVRLRNAKLLLEEENLRISDIAVKTGFGSSKYFISVFKKAMGVTPAEWREKHFLKP